MRIKIQHEKHVALSLKKRWLSRYVCLVIVLLNRVLCLMCGNGGVDKLPHSLLLLCRRREPTRSKGLSFRTTRQCCLEGARRRKSSGSREMLGWASRPLVRWGFSWMEEQLDQLQNSYWELQCYIWPRWYCVLRLTQAILFNIHTQVTFTWNLAPLHHQLCSYFFCSDQCSLAVVWKCMW